MSYDLALWSSDHPITNGKAQDIYKKLCAGNLSDIASLLEARDEIDICLKEITSKYPRLSDYSDDLIDECVWSSDFDESDRHVLLSISYSRVDEVLPFVLEVATQHNLLCYDPQKNRIISPNKSAA